MPVDTNTQKALDLNTLPVPPGVRILSVQAEDYTNWDGEPALRVNVVLDESTDVVKSARKIGDFKWAIRESLRKHGIDLFAYIFLAKPSELAEVDED